MFSIEKSTKIHIDFPRWAFDLVGGLEPWNFMIFHSVISSSQLTKKHIFQRGRLNHQPGKQIIPMCQFIVADLSHWWKPY